MKLYTEKDLLAAFDAGMAYATASHKQFKQVHPNRKEYIKKLKDGNKTTKG